MPPRPEFRPDENKVLLPWREYHVSGTQMALASVVGVALVAVAWFVDGQRQLPQYVAAAVVFGTLFPAFLYLVRNWLTYSAIATPVALDADGIVAPTLLGTAYVPWTKVRALAHVRSLMGRSRSPVEFNLIAFPRKGMPIRLSLPELSGDERHQLFEILGNISRRYGFEFILDHTPEGQRSLRRLPWFWF